MVEGSRKRGSLTIGEQFLIGLGAAVIGNVVYQLWGGSALAVVAIGGDVLLLFAVGNWIYDHLAHRGEVNHVSKQVTQMGHHMVNQEGQSVELLREQLRDELRAVHELVAEQPTRTEFNELRADVRQLQADVKTIRQVMAEHAGELEKLDARVSEFESA
jgi:polyhydroxyalkanoate synthesis regulator phasin